MSISDIGAALVLTALFSGVGALFLFFEREKMEEVTSYLMSLAAGTIFGGVFIHLIFRLSNGLGYNRLTGLMIVMGMLGSFFLEKVVHWHCHHRGTHEEPFAYVLAAGDGVHNILDGILVSTSFLASGSAGIAATIAVIAHKIPKEMGDFGVMVEAGFSRFRALLVNIGLSLLMFVGAGAVFGLSEFSAGAVNILLPLVIGNFVFIAGSDLLPELKDRENWLIHIAVFSAGVAFMYAIPFLKQLF